MHIAIISRMGKLSVSSNTSLRNISSTVSNSPVRRENMSHTRTDSLPKGNLASPPPSSLPQRKNLTLSPCPDNETSPAQRPLFREYPGIVQWANPNMRFVIFIQKQTVRRYVTFQAPVFALGCHGEKNSHSTDDDRKYSFHFILKFILSP